MIKIILTCWAVASIVTVHGQAWRSNATSRLDKHGLDLSVSIMGGTSYFGYDNGAIKTKFLSPEITLEVLLSKRVADHLKLQTGVRTSYKFKKKPAYDYNAPEQSNADFRYQLVEVDHVMSEFGHSTFGIPVKIQYQPGKVGLTLGGLVRHFAGSKTSGYPSDWLAGRYDAGLLGGIGFDVKQVQLGVEYYHGMVNVHKMGSYDTVGGPDIVQYKKFNRYAQVVITYRFANK